MIDDKMGVEILEIMDLIRKRYGKVMKEKDKKALIDINKRLYDRVGGIAKDPMVHQNPLSEPVPGGYQVAPARQAESLDIKRLMELAIQKVSR